MATDNTTARKRKQENWSDFVYSSPNSPQQQLGYSQQQQQQQHHDFNIDSIFTAAPHEHENNAGSRRHSVAVGEMHFHSFDKPHGFHDLEQLLGASLPSSWSSSSSGGSTVQNSNTNVDMIPHRRALSLRLDTPTQPIDMHRASMSTASPTTPAFFSPSFLDALKQEDDIMFDSNNHFSDDIIHDFMMSTSAPATASSVAARASTTSIATTTATTTITPSVISTGDDVNNLTNWLLNQPTANNNVVKRKSSTASTTASSASPSSSSVHIMSTPSPPSAPMTSLYQQQHPSIPEEEDEDIDTNLLRNSTINSRIMQGANNASIMKPLIQKYLATLEDERKIVILTSKVAQKSYGTEKRFLCPPPSTVLSGASWHTTNPTTALSSKPLPPNLVVQISGEKTSQNGVIEWHNSTNTVIDANSIMPGDTVGVTGNCVSKQLHINDADEKRKRVEVYVKVSLGNGIHLGSFASKGIKVISKPSKKRQSVKNMELCIHHGTTISLFNRIRSQTVSTKYLGVSTNNGNGNSTGTCFVARTASWDPFVIWIVDTARSPDAQQPQQLPHHPDNPHFPPPPAIALQSAPGQAPIALHYNQTVVLQCVNTGLVSPVMVIRKVDKGSMIMGGNRLDDLSGPTGGECGDEALGDPVSQLHKIAFQIVQDPSIAHSNKTNYRHYQLPQHLPSTEWTLPQTSQAVTYLACLDNVVGMHKTTTERSFVAPRPIPPTPPTSSISTSALTIHNNMPLESSLLSSSWSTESTFDGYDAMCQQQQQQQQQQHQHLMETGGGKMTRKRRVSCDVTGKPLSLPIMKNTTSNRRRVNSLNDGVLVKHENTGAGRRSSLSSDRRGSISSDSGIYHSNGACWTEDVSDASVWTIVGTDCATYRFWTPPAIVDLNSPFSGNTMAASPITPFPILSATGNQLVHNANIQQMLHLTGENFARDLSVWFGDIKAPRTDYKSRESISCSIPDIQELLESPTSFLDNETQQHHKIPLLFVRGDGVVYNTDMFYSF
ncbi:hypothetical protein [Parasitella parasitica]|uniref:LAG1-DNAbind-domain-containing protein n=1 Tax=Parasitella parasitica TaxID=35722 RepID=A0A0B7MUM4_9FUNG|nr:hypothetical protein [Parasitella parasitica]